MNRGIVVTVGLLLALSSCGAADPVSRSDINLSEYNIDLAHSSFAAGELSLTLENQGELPHTIVISADDGVVVAASDIVEVGMSSTFTVALDPGEYEFTCRIVAVLDGELIDHYELGMVESVTVEG